MEIGFVNFNQEALNRANKVMKLLQGQGAIDEMGLGRIRDAFSNEMFPGLSTLQTHAKYFLLMPALYSYLERTRLNDSREVRNKIREHEIAITRRLIDGSPEAVGIIGADSLNKSSDYVKYDPTYVYQAGMEKYGLIKTGGNLYALICERSKGYQNTPQKQRGASECGDDAEELAGREQIFTTCGINYDFNSKEPISIALNKAEASFLKEHIVDATKDSLLSYLLDTDLYEVATENSLDFEALGEVLKGKLPDKLWTTYSLALRFSHFADLLRIRFAMLFDKAVGANDAALEEETDFYELLERKRFEFKPESINEIIRFLDGRVTEQSCKNFCLEVSKLITSGDFDGLDKLIAIREKTIKGMKRSKLANAQEFELGKPFEKSPSMSYRWNTIGFTVLKEIKEGLRNE